MNTETFWQQVTRRLDAGTAVFVSLVVANTSGSPGTLGARLLVDANGDVAGTIGGGIMEAKLVQEARRLLGDEDGQAAPELRLLVHRKGGTDHPSGLICAGEQTNINLLLQPQLHADSIRQFSAAVSGHSTDALTLTIDTHGLHVAPAGADDAPGMALTETANAWHYRESSLNPQHMAIVGGGHCGKALAGLAVQIGYRVEVFDDRDGVLHSAEWPDQARLHTLADYGDLDGHIHYPALTTVVVMTSSVWHDIAALAAVATRKLHWLGVMGSAAKLHEIRRQLVQRGIAQAHIDAIIGPIGLPMKSDKPAEIAVSIMAQLLAEKTPNPRSGERSRDRQRPGS